MTRRSPLSDVTSAGPPGREPDAPRTTAGTPDLQPPMEADQEGTGLAYLCSWDSRSSVSAGHQAAPHARVPSIPVVTDLSCHLVPRPLLLHSGSCLFFPSLTPLYLSPALEPWEELSFLVCFPGSGRTQLISTGEPAPSHLTARWRPRPPALASGPHTLTQTGGTLASAPGCGEALEAAFGLLSPPCPPSPEVRKKKKKTGELLCLTQCHRQKKGPSGCH